MKLIILTGEAKVGKTHALELLKKVNDGTIDYFEDDVRDEDIPKLLERKEKLGVVVRRFNKVYNSSPAFLVDLRNVFVITNHWTGEFYVNNLLDGESKLYWTEAFNWLKSNSSTKEKPEIVDEFFSYICK
jgi:hypothetical protein